MVNLVQKWSLWPKKRSIWSKNDHFGQKKGSIWSKNGQLGPFNGQFRIIFTETSWQLFPAGYAEAACLPQIENTQSTLLMSFLISD